MWYTLFSFLFWDNTDCDGVWMAWTHRQPLIMIITQTSAKPCCKQNSAGDNDLQGGQYVWKKCFCIISAIDFLFQGKNIYIFYQWENFCPALAEIEQCQYSNRMILITLYLKDCCNYQEHNFISMAAPLNLPHAHETRNEFRVSPIFCSANWPLVSRQSSICDQCEHYFIFFCVGFSSMIFLEI